MMNGSAIRTGACLLWNPRGSRIDLARQFALRLQLSTNTHDMPEVRPVRPKKRSALIKPSLLLEATSHTAMGIRRRKHETHDNSISLCVRALQYVRACKNGSS